MRKVALFITYLIFNFSLRSPSIIQADILKIKSILAVPFNGISILPKTSFIPSALVLISVSGETYNNNYEKVSNRNVVDSVTCNPDSLN